MTMILLLTVMGASLLETSLADANILSASRMQAQAVSNAIMGSQDAVARLRTTSFDWGSLPYCQTAATCPTTPPPFVVTDPGTRYVTTVFRRARDAVVTRGDQTPNIIVSAVGFSDNTNFSVLMETELQMPNGAGQGNSVDD